MIKKSSMQIKRGLKRNLPLLKDGQLGYCKDTNELWIGNDGINKQIGGNITGGSTDNTVATESIILLSPNGSAFKVSVDNIGQLLVEKTVVSNNTTDSIKLVSPNGTTFKIAVDNEGQLLINKDESNNVPDTTPPETVDYTGLLINQVYGGGKDAACSHHFVELYNTTDKAMSLEGVSLYGATYKAPDWQHIPLKGVIPAKSSYLIRGVASTNSIVSIDNYDLQCDLKLDKAMKVFLIKSTDPDFLKGIPNPWNADGAFHAVEGYIDGFGCHGNSGLMGDSLVDTIDGFETEAPGGGDPGTDKVGCGGNSKQTSMRRINFADTDVNSEDFEALRYANFLTDETLKDKQPRWVAYGPWSVGDVFEPPVIDNSGDDSEEGNFLVTENNDILVTENGDKIMYN